MTGKKMQKKFTLEDEVAVESVEDKEAVESIEDVEAVNSCDDEEAVDSRDDEEAVDSRDDEEAVDDDYDPTGYELLSDDGGEVVDEESDEEPQIPKPEPNMYAYFSQDTWLTRHPGAASFRVSVPKIDDGYVKVSQGFIEIHVDTLQRTVGFLKEEIGRKLNVPCDKIILSWKWGGMNKNKWTLAAYNVKPGELLFLSRKEVC